MIIKGVYSLQVLGPGRRIRHGHEEAVGQDGEHDEEAEQRGKRVKETAPGVQVNCGFLRHTDAMFPLILRNAAIRMNNQHVCQCH